MDGDTERRLISALGTLSLSKSTTGKHGGLTETQAAQTQIAMQAIGNVLLEEEQLRKEQGRVHRIQARAYRPRACGVA